MHPEIEKLIDLALADGEVTEKERGIILRKAVSLGLDIDEVEMILDGRIALSKKESNTSQGLMQNNNKEGTLKKCPSCGALFQSFATKCSDCGHEFRGIDATKSISDLLTQLREIEFAIRNEKRNLYERIMDPTGVLSANKYDVKIAKAKSQIILNFPVPNTKEDLLETLSTAVANSNSKFSFSSFSLFSFVNLFMGSGNANSIIKKTWRVKCEEIIMKSRFSLKDDKKTLAEIDYYAKQLGIK
jgi:hypothetical protein